MKVSRFLLPLPAVLTLVATVACDRQPELAGADDSGTLPVLVSQAQQGRFVVERIFSGQVRAHRELKVLVREPGVVRAVPAPPDSQPVVSGQLLVELHSPELELELEGARAELERARTAHRRQLELANLGLAAQTEVDESRAMVERAGTQVEQLELRRRQLRVSAAATGIILDTGLPGVGQWCASGQELARIIDPEGLKVEVAVPATWESSRSVQGAVIELGEGTEIEATVASLSAAVEPERGGRIMTLDPGPSRGLAANAMVTVRLITQLREQAVTVPVEALVEGAQGSWTVVTGPAPGTVGSVKRIPVMVGPNDGRRVVIEDGLAAGTWVAIVNAPELLSSYRVYAGVGQ
jgi:RND family efflux transporter MFP subunit